MRTSSLHVAWRGSAVWLTLNRPKVRNALHSELIATLTKTFLQLSGRARVVVLQGAGPAFCSGADIEEMLRNAESSLSESWEQAKALQRMFQTIADFPGVTIARVHGAAVGGGAGLAAVCDIALAAEEAFFSFGEVRLGLIPATIAPWVVQKTGLGAARALFVTGERIPSTEALRLGLVQQVTLGSGLDEAVERKVEAVLQSGPEAVAAIKRLLGHLQTPSFSQIADLTVASLVECRASAEAHEGLQAFLEKRRASFVETL